MKKTIITVIAAVAAALAFTACNKNAAKVENSIDSLSYAAGYTYSDGLLAFQLAQGLDSAYIKDFIKGIENGVKEKNDKEKAYAMGQKIGNQIAERIFPMINEQMLGGDSNVVVNQKAFMAAFIANLNGDSISYFGSAQEAGIYMQETAEEITENSMAKKYGDNKAAGEAWLENNKSQEGVVVTESGLQYKIIELGTGEKPQASDRVKCNYKGTLIDGTEFDSSYKRNEPATIPLSSVIAGWTEGFQLMPAGSKFELYVPYQLGYQYQDKGVIKPFSTLIFEVEFISIDK